MIATLTIAFGLLATTYAQFLCYSCPLPEDDCSEVQVRNATAGFGYQDVPTLQRAQRDLKRAPKELQRLAKPGLKQAIIFMEDSFPPPPPPPPKKKGKKKRKKKKRKKKKEKKKKKKKKKEKKKKEKKKKETKKKEKKKKEKKKTKKGKKNKQQEQAKKSFDSCCPRPHYSCTSVSLPLRCLQFNNSLCFVVSPCDPRFVYYQTCRCHTCVLQDFIPTIGRCVATDYEQVQMVAYCPQLPRPYTFVKLLVPVPRECQCRTHCPTGDHGPQVVVPVAGEEKKAEVRNA